MLKVTHRGQNATQPVYINPSIRKTDILVIHAKAREYVFTGVGLCVCVCVCRL